MRRIPFLLFLLTMLYAAAGPAVSRTPGMPAILVLGDSLSAAHNIAVDQGWVHLLDVRLKDMRPTWRVVNASISGETSLTGRNRLPDLLKQYRPCVVVLELGANDGLQGLSIRHMQDNLEAMIRASQAAGARVLLLGIELPVNYGPRYRNALRKVYADLAAKYHTGLVPFLLEGVALDPDLMQADGLHPTAAGEPRVLENVWRALQPLLGKIHHAAARH